MPYSKNNNGRDFAPSWLSRGMGIGDSDVESVLDLRDIKITIPGLYDLKFCKKRYELIAGMATSEDIGRFK